MTAPISHLLQSSAGSARRILDKAIEATTDSSTKTEAMLCLIRRARGLLATIEDMPGDILSPPGHHAGKNGE